MGPCAPIVKILVLLLFSARFCYGPRFACEIPNLDKWYSVVRNAVLVSGLLSIDYGAVHLNSNRCILWMTHEGLSHRN